MVEAMLVSNNVELILFFRNYLHKLTKLIGKLAKAGFISYE